MTELQRSTSKPVVPSMRAMLANKPYMMYLLFNVPFKLAALIPINVIIDYLKFNAKVPPPPHHTQCFGAQPHYTHPSPSMPCSPSQFLSYQHLTPLQFFLINI